MTLELQPFDKVDERDLTQLIDYGVRESQRVEYKSTVILSDDQNKKEFLKDLSSFANSLGGDLIVGMEAVDGVPKKLNGIEGLNLDKELLRLESIARDGLEPRVFGLAMRGISLANGNSAILIRIPKSWNGPHRVCFKGWNKFFCRNSAGAYELNVEDLRSFFSLSEGLAEKIRNFRAERLSKIVAGDTPAKLKQGAFFVIHLVPLASFQDNMKVDLAKAKKSFQLFRPPGALGLNDGINFNGLLITSSADADHSVNCYSQVFRDGSIESAMSGIIFEGQTSKELAWPFLHQEFFTFVESACKGLKELGVSPPIAIMLSLLGVRGSSLKPNGYFFRDRVRLTDDRLITNEVILESPEFEGAWHKKLRAPLDQIWNAYGFLSALDFDREGNWKPSQ